MVPRHDLVVDELAAARPEGGDGWLFPSRRGERRERYAEDLLRLCAAVLGPEGPTFRAHALRRFFATEAARKGWPLKTTMRYGGWERLDTLVEIYQQVDRADLVKAALGEDEPVPPARE